MPKSVVTQIKIMISSTDADLAQYREEASKIIKKVAAEKENKVQLVEVSMEKETQSGDRELAVAVSKSWVEEANWVVVIVGFNYGTISHEDGADGLSVTEWEYKHAFELRKKLFVFIAGDEDTKYEYRVSDEEKKDLKNWMRKQTEDQQNKLDKFRKELTVPHTAMFANLRMFRERLEKTLKDNIDALPVDIQPGTRLAELIFLMMPDIRECIRKVTLIEGCKRIHDYLHELRQHVIRPLREEVLLPWAQEGTLSETRKYVIGKCVGRVSEKGGITDASRSIGPEKHGALADCVDKVLQCPELWNESSDSPDSRLRVQDFTERVDEFAQAVQNAFSEADRSMTQEESDLRECYLALLDRLKQARQQCKLDLSDNERLNQELEKVEANRKRVECSLGNHHKWQESHDKLHELDSLREAEDLFGRQLNRYRDNSLSNHLLPLVVGELREAEAHEAGSTETVQGGCAGVVRSVSARSWQDCPPACGLFVDRLKRLKGRLEGLRDAGGAAAFDEMRMPFDDAFYCVDKRTLEEVSSAGKRARDLEAWLDNLATRVLKMK